MIQISSLYSLQNISDCYYINSNLDIININTDHIKSKTLGKRGYMYVTLNDKQNKQIKVYVHKIVALAFIRNSEYEVINHKDGNKLNNSIENLEFCTHQYNTVHAFKNNLIPINSKVFKITFFVQPFFNHYLVGTMKELAIKTGIPIQTLYFIYYNKNISSKYSILSIDEFDNTLKV